MPNRSRLANKINMLVKKGKHGIKIPVAAKIQTRRAPASKELDQIEELAAKTEWQINWMNQFAQTKEQAQVKINEQQSLNKELEDNIRELKKKVAKQHDMLVKTSALLDKKDRQINKYKSRAIEAKKYADMATNTDPMCADIATNTETAAKQPHVDMATNTDPLSGPMCVDVVTNTDPVSCQLHMDVVANPLSADVYIHQMSSDHDYAIKYTEQSSQVSFQAASHQSNEQAVANEHQDENDDAYQDRSANLEIQKCPDCSYETNKRDNMKTHRAESCVTKPNRNRPCKFCDKMFTRRQLRVHLNNYVRDQHKPTGKHRNFSLADHVAYLNEIKAERKTGNNQ